MPHILIAGIVATAPEVENFPERGRPRSEVRIRVEDDGTTAIFRVLAHDDQMDELSTLLPGDSVCVQGRLQVESKPAGSLASSSSPASDGLAQAVGQPLADRLRTTRCGTVRNHAYRVSHRSPKGR